mmetsp:Transcript_39822/g.112980  ORF Transcript_39822/g.112980 Transcript_39822/m.112980 type:complete len:369 (-) Transcript_39822:310-1416(-)|eukprot:CAMPEP_0117664648 /NCGR_PEP_ID=MMETSP0804-20121206/9345_1 /TAXON_ID=1074897 /ORGANISM="Tetraselmis astigmatica, Strain CCMP880" /LENGTH=368 /DNA_ID=CAMNT_0005471921 /DNA_START=612 /DNA_END=1718 /DNA_ORIENTATION=-
MNAQQLLLTAASLLLLSGAYAEQAARPMFEVDHSARFVKRLTFRYPALFNSSWTARALGAEAMSSGVHAFETDWNSGYSAYYTTQLQDGVPLVIDGHHGHPATVCVSEKAGSTRWKQLIHKEMSGQSLQGGAVHGHNATWLPQSFEQWQEEVMLPERMRFMIVRNPYARVLSAFLDKCVGNHDIHIRCPGNPYKSGKAEFARFIQLLLETYIVQHKHMNGHWSPLAEHCGLPKGFKYHFYLKSEEMDVWYPEFISYLGMEASAMSGWSYKDGALDCFYALSEMTCNQTDLAIRYHTRKDVGTKAKREDPLSELPSYAQHASTPHATGADAHIMEYYTPEIAELVEKLYEKDFQEFGYKKMDVSQLVQE